MVKQTWFWSDTHFHHKNIIEFCARPFKSLEEMHTALIENYCKKVKPGDTCYFLGDIFFGTYAEAYEIMQHLPGRKILIQGNHDKFSQQQYRSLGFEFVAEEALICLFGRRLRLCHYPKRPPWWKQWFSRYTRALRYLDRRPPDDGRWLLHGHTHSPHKLDAKRRMIHVGVDAWNFGPINVGEIESLIARGDDGRAT